MEYLYDLLVNLHWGAVGQIILIDLLLGGDNAVVIALACRDLPHNHRLQGIVIGTAGAIILRVILITCAVALLDLPFLKVAEHQTIYRRQDHYHRRLHHELG